MPLGARPSLSRHMPRVAILFFRSHSLRSCFAEKNICHTSAKHKRGETGRARTQTVQQDTGRPDRKRETPSFFERFHYAIGYGENGVGLPQTQTVSQGQRGELGQSRRWFSRTVSKKHFVNFHDSATNGATGNKEAL